MGDIAEMMLDGTLCGSCGTLLSGEAYGVPRYCKDCRKPGVTRKRRKKKKRR
jgi:uncharacterized CHY-type Zn-finger protein